MCRGAVDTTQYIFSYFRCFEAKKEIDGKSAHILIIVGNNGPSVRHDIYIFIKIKGEISRGYMGTCSRGKNRFPRSKKLHKLQMDYIYFCDTLDLCSR